MIECVSNKDKYKRTRESEDGPPRERGRPPKFTNTLHRYPPIHEGIEDRVSEVALRLESSKQKPRKDTVISLMKKTFHTRLHYVLQEAKSVSIILDIATL